MPRLHLITAHRCLDRSDEPVVIYCGHDADKAGAARDEVLHRGEFALADKWTPETRHTRYATAANQAQAKEKHLAIQAKKQAGLVAAKSRKAKAEAEAKAKAEAEAKAET